MYVYMSGITKYKVCDRDMLRIYSKPHITSTVSLMMQLLNRLGSSKHPNCNNTTLLFDLVLKSYYYRHTLMILFSHHQFLVHLLKEN